MTIVEFLTARLDEAEADAIRAGADHWIHDGGIHHESHHSDDVVDWVYGEAWEHIARNDPAYVLADIAAKREVIRWCGERDQIWIGTVASNPELPDPKDFVPGYLKNPSDSMVLRFLAVIYSEHPDYDEAWKP